MNRVMQYRKAKKLTRTELAANVGVSERYIFFIEKGERTPSMKVAKRLAEVLCAGIEDIFLDDTCTKSTYSDEQDSA